MADTTEQQEDAEAVDTTIDVQEDDDVPATTENAEPQDDAGYENPSAGGAYAGGDADVPTESAEEEFLRKAQGCLVALVVASCAELAQAARVCDKGYSIGALLIPVTECSGSLLFAVLVGAISAALNLIFGAGLWFRQAMFKDYIPYFAVMMVLLWGFGVAVCTFDKPFTTTGNGYFTTWGAAIISVYFAQISFVKLHALLGKAFTGAVSGTLERRVAMLVMIFSYVCAFACLTIENGAAGALSSNQETWGFACGITCGALITIWMLLKSFTGIINGYPSSLKFLSYILTIMWLFGVGVLTFDAPFTTTGNGYFTAWGAFLGSIYLAYVTTMVPTPDTAKE